MELLYTTKEIAEMYGGKSKNVTPYMITQTWIPNGLRYIKGKGNSYLFKKEWVEQYIEEQAMKQERTSTKVISIRRGTKRVANNNCFVH